MFCVIEKTLALLCDKIICISDAERKSALKNKICSEKKLCVIFNGIDLQEYKKNEGKKILREDLGITEDDIIIGMAGRLSEQKAPDVFIKTMDLIKKEIPNIFIIMVGGGELQEEVENYAN